jgi:hypothetical protein
MNDFGEKCAKISAALWLTIGADTCFAKLQELVPPFELQWGATPDAVHNLLTRIMRPVVDPVSASAAATSPQSGAPGASPGGSSDANLASASQGVVIAGVSGLYLAEQQYEGEVFAARADRVVPLFFLSQLFGLVSSFPPSPDAPASLIWERLVEQVTRQYGPPRTRTKPVSLLSWNAVLQVIPPEANKSALLRIYNEADRDPKVGGYVLQDLQVQTGLWVPEATWPFQKGGSIKAVMQAGGRNEFGLFALRPLLIMVKHDMFP